MVNFSMFQFLDLLFLMSVIDNFVEVYEPYIHIIYIIYIYTHTHTHIHTHTYIYIVKT